MSDRTAPPGFGEFVSARYPALVRYGALLTGDRGHGEDLTQDALVKTYRAWRRLHPQGDPEAYTRQVMVRAAWRSGRRLWRFEIPAEVLPDRPAAGDVADQLGTADLVLAALRELPAGQRVVLVLRYWANLSEQEIAAQLNCSIGTVKSRASRAITALRRADGPLAGAFALADGPRR
ncbi:RNA polymerase sigma-E factor [Actinoplanes sp. SE50]|uniref:SigE family RNA polymerase sigma factor n=1 Tax=unclassified Actinoplanes TaxID=2626549 RepID=UPI00023EC2E7|nr:MULTISPECIES: SigE family RNA polymerase sigma factor [unclassified Actinoplanes]AEV85807.1 RNA polymerase sigma-E factor [Actinoplanes sp. SE50/110]ATO84201.1 RNA polymerase sigma-E factor [Actinoplanes sp. SE50]SLM01611.1 RNA polymerase sigma-E factor [Actinoplanes sp. SE50/110]